MGNPGGFLDHATVSHEAITATFRYGFNTLIFQTQGQTSASFEAVGPMIEAIFMGQLAMRSGEKLYWAGPEMRCTNNATANDLVRPVYRAGWSL